MKSILALYITLMPVILAGILNMIFCKSPLFEGRNAPMDRGHSLRDGKRLFGANKTWKGFWGMVFFGALSQLVWGWLLQVLPELGRQHLIYSHYENSLPLNLLLGSLLGLAYVLFELPNSFVKRRLDIRPGKTADNGWKWLFILLDQIDSLLGCILVLLCFISLSWQQLVGILLVGTLTHLGVNRILFLLKLRKNRI